MNTKMKGVYTKFRDSNVFTYLSLYVFSSSFLGLCVGLVRQHPIIIDIYSKKIQFKGIWIPLIATITTPVLIPVIIIESILDDIVITDDKK